MYKRGGKTATCDMTSSGDPTLSLGRGSWHNLDADRLALPDDTFAETFQAQAGQPCFTLLDLRNLVYMFERHRADIFMARPLRTFHFAFYLLNPSGLQKKPRRVRCAYIKAEGTIWSDGNSCWDWNPRGDMGSAGIELLVGISSS